MRKHYANTMKMGTARAPSDGNELLELRIPYRKLNVLWLLYYYSEAGIASLRGGLVVVVQNTIFFEDYQSSIYWSMKLLDRRINSQMFEWRIQTKIKFITYSSRNKYHVKFPARFVCKYLQIRYFIKNLSFE